jgi:hypothetical protein
MFYGRVNMFKTNFYLGIITATIFLGLPNTSYAGGVLPDTLDYTYKLYSSQSVFDTPMPVSFDGTSYWAPSGGGISSPLHQYDPITGDVIGTSVPGIDFRSSFADASGNIFASGYSDNRIYPMTSLGVFDLGTTFALQTVTPNDQAPVILSPDGTQYASRVGDTINFWSVIDGSWQSALTLSGYGTVSGEVPSGNDQTNLDLAVYGAYYLTYLEGSDEVFAWDTSGNRVGNLTLLNNSSATAYSFSYSNGYLFTNGGGEYRGYALAPPVAAPEPGTLAMSLFGLAGLIMRRRRKAA